MARSFEVETVGAGRDVVLVPGAACDGRAWSRVVPRLTDRYRCHVLSLAGFAGRPPIEGGRLLDVVHDELGPLIASMNRPALVGHSLGAFVVLRAAIAAPDAVGPIVLVDGVPALGPLLAPGKSAEAIAASAREQADATRRASREALRAHHARSFATMFVDPNDAAELTRHGAESDPETVADAMYTLWTTDLRPDLGRVRTPVLFVAPGFPGFARDAIEERHALYREQLAGLPNVRMEVVDDARHFVPYDAPGRLARLIATHIRP